MVARRVKIALSYGQCVDLGVLVLAKHVTFLCVCEKWHKELDDLCSAFQPKLSWLFCKTKAPSCDSVSWCFICYAEITTHPQDRLVPVGSSVSLTCTSSVSSDVTFSWTHNGRDVTAQSTSTGDTSILTITNVMRSDGGSYVCTVRSGSLSVMSNTSTLTTYGM